MGLDQSQFELIGGSLMAGGVLIAGLAFLLLWFAAFKAAGLASSPRLAPDPSLPRVWLIALAGILVAGLALRLWGLDARGMSHPELYTPNIDLPEGLSDPPPRHGLAETAGYHFFWEPHPFGYYLGKWAWTKLFGTSLFAIRLPEALIGAASVYLTYRVGRLAYDARVGVVAAAIIAVHGLHVFWSQMARMYVPGAFFGLLATWMLLELARRERPSPWIEAAYVAAIAASALTVEFTWPLLAGHLLWIGLRPGGGERGVPRLAAWPALALILASPMLAHALIGARGEAAPAPTLSFILEWFSLSFLARPNEVEGIPAITAGLMALATIPIVVRGLFAKTGEAVVASSAPAPRLWPLALAAAGAATAIVGVALAAPQRKAVIAAVAIVPLLGLAAPPVLAWMRRTVGAGAAMRRFADPAALVPLLAVVPPVLVFVVSFAVALTAERTYLQFTPYIVIAAAAGLVALWPRRAQFIAAALSLTAALAFAFFLHKQAPSTPRDYAGLARAIQADLREGDVIFTREHHWAYSPMFYYLPADRFVADDFQSAVEQARGARVWLIDFDAADPDPEAVDALAGHRLLRRVRVKDGGALLYEGPAP